MNDLNLYFILGVCMAAVVIAAHFVRTWAFNRHEAITFESSAAAFLISVLLLFRYGFSAGRLLLAGVLLLGFVFNAFGQWHFYMELQDVIKNAFAERASYLKENGPPAEEGLTEVTDQLMTMASVAIMPSFSRFIEESKLFNNPGSLIGLIKSLMKRQRFQKKKYLMRECFAENINLIGPCKPAVDRMMEDNNGVVPGAIHANDLALGTRSEVIGLLWYDAFGFGAFALILRGIAGAWTGAPVSSAVPAGFPFAAAVLAAVLVFTGISHLLRHYGFARYESIAYECIYAVLLAAAFLAADEAVTAGAVSAGRGAAVGAAALLFFAASFVNRRMDRKLHHDREQGICRIFDRMIACIPPETETNKAKRRFLRNLKVISEWAVVPFQNGGRMQAFLHRKTRAAQPAGEKQTLAAKLRRFEQINEAKKDMPRYMDGLAEEIAPECKGMASESDFRVPDAELHRTRTVMALLCAAGLVVLAVCIGLGM